MRSVRESYTTVAAEREIGETVPQKMFGGKPSDLFGIGLDGGEFRFRNGTEAVHHRAIASNQCISHADIDYTAYPAVKSIGCPFDGMLRVDQH